MKSRVREFNEVRTKNLSQYFPSCPNTQTSKTSLYGNKETNNHSLIASSFLKKSKPQVCVGCTNKRIIQTKKEKEVKEKQKDRLAYKAQLQQLEGYKDPNQEYRQKMKKDANQFNKTLIATKKSPSNSFQKALSSKILKQQAQKQQMDLYLEKQRSQEQQARLIQYRKDLFLQYQSQLQRKRNIKMQQRKNSMNSIPIKGFDNSAIVKQYQQQLKRQMNQQKFRKQLERQKQLVEDKKIILESQKQFERFTQFSKKSYSNINPEVFQQIELNDYSKRIQKIQDRQRKNQQRLEQLEREKILSKSQRQQNTQIKKQYERELKNQITQKTIRKIALKEADIKQQESFYKYSEQIAGQSKILKPCEQCHHQYEEKCLI